MRKIQVFFVAATIFFLTGCAARSYHRTSNIGSLSVGFAPAPVTMQGSLGWPARGKVEVPFGGREDGASIRGVVIRVQEGSPVCASADGKVVFLDEQLPGYGKTIILEHGSGFSTVYARNAQVLVSLGQLVKKGQQIARSGKAGKGLWPQLYFEVRKNSKALNPADHLS